MKKILIVGNVGVGKTVLSEAIFKIHEETVEHITPEEAKERGIDIISTMPIKPNPVHQIVERHVSPDAIKSGQQKRRERRKKRNK